MGKARKELSLKWELYTTWTEQKLPKNLRVQARVTHADLNWCLEECMLAFQDADVLFTATTYASLGNTPAVSSPKKPCASEMTPQVASG